MKKQFDSIPDCVWKLFAEIIWIGSYDEPPVLLDGGDRADALLICWGWDPPLLKGISHTQLTAHGLAAHCWHKQQKPDRKSTWQKQAKVAKGLGIHKVSVGRLIESGDLRTNGLKGVDCRVDPDSIIEYCNREGVSWNET